MEQLKNEVEDLWPLKEEIERYKEEISMKTEEFNAMEVQLIEMNNVNKEMGNEHLKEIKELNSMCEKQIEHMDKRVKSQGIELQKEKDLLTMKFKELEIEKNQWIHEKELNQAEIVTNKDREIRELKESMDNKKVELEKQSLLDLEMKTKELQSKHEEELQAKDLEVNKKLFNFEKERKADVEMALSSQMNTLMKVNAEKLASTEKMLISSKNEAITKIKQDHQEVLKKKEIVINQMEEQN